jgi:hypothetical protein
LNEITEGPCQGGCGYVLMYEQVTLLSKSTGSNRSIRITTSFGRRVLRMIAGEEAAFASELQFELRKDTVAGLWLLRHVATATHPTYYDGWAVGSDPVPVVNGGQISIGPDRMKLTLKLES